jgi:NDP-sugar pyrophosphorylase family protein
MQAVLMAGGKGTRLRPFTNILPKPLVPIGEISVLEMVIRQLRYYGFKHVVIAVGHKAELIMAIIGDGSRFGLDITYHYEDEPLGTMGALSQIDNLEDNFVVMNGDICTTLNFMEFCTHHVNSGAVATVAVYSRHEKIELGVIDADESKERIIGFTEKPTYDFLVSMGVNAFQKSIVDLIPKNRFFGFDDLMLKLLEEKRDVRCFPFDGLWHDIGRPDDYELMLEDFKSNHEAYLPEGS